ncbi:hypothetical protein [Aeoliella mucimassa]|uniref:Uncharacterized protein n=1 Tax=Aeoliella mucimassa TaxID=2527972 RepID=A0A518AND9_9BACT|nr:hypothetical protein [Aeoliella mucimassa]QDU56238.1 hypothetical protein Pan181_24460 [Aeoliella mucimassa]
MADDDSDPLEQQQELAESSLPLLFETYDQAIERGLKTPVVILVDCEDEIGGQIARAWLGDDAVDDAIANNTDSETTVYARAESWKQCKQAVPETFEYLAPVFAEGPPDDGFLVVSVTAGGASALSVPMDARE